MKKILFPFELNNPIYREAYVYAVKFARNLGAELIMLNVFDFELDDSITKVKYDQQVRKNWLHAYEEIIRFHKYYLGKHLRAGPDLRIKVDYRFLHGKLINEIRNIITADAVDLIVLPLSESRDMNRRQLEIIRTDVFENNRVSLLVIPCQGHYRLIDKIVFATDLKELNNYQLYINDIVMLAKIFNASIHFIHISPGDKTHIPADNEAYKSIMQIIQKNSKHIFRTLNGKDVSGMVLDYVGKNKAELLTVIKHHHFFLETLFHKSFSDEMSLKSKVPVLVMREITG